MILILYKYHNRPLEQWHSVTLNTVVSVLSTATKTGLLLVAEESISQWKWILYWRETRPFIDFERLDKASRGPKGSANLLWKLRKP